ncbi:MAG: AmmeMemoRadiSam system protein B [Ignavibacteriaceae bacterium]|nr:AmmeMemoRadiSam system protein B [Ignavibacteriaceae bacterium]
MTSLSVTGNVQCSGNDSNGQIRKPAFAGQFYPADSSKLLKSIEYFLNNAVTENTGKPIALIAPHAGYIYAGQIIADSYNQAKNYKYDLIVILGTNHTTAGFNKISFYPGSGFQTPLGISKIDTQTAEEMVEVDNDCVFYESVHTQEHSIEVQLPFIQHLFPDVKILPVVIGTPDYEMCVKFGKALARVVKDKNALIVASSDLSHYPAYEDAEHVDKNTLEAAASLDFKKFELIAEKQPTEGIANLATSACGEGPVIAAMAASKELGADCGTIVSYANSGSTLVGNRQKVVGYGSVIFSVNSQPPKNYVFNNPSPEEKSFELNDQDKKALLSFARLSITQYLESETVPLARGFSANAEKNIGAFVTLRKHKDLRGCIGYMREDLPLCEVVGSMALQAAFNDQRFNPLSKDELSQVTIEISALTPYKPIKSDAEIILGRDGVVIRKSGKQAVFLPQVATEQGWNKEELLDNLCRKAGLQAGDWKQGAQLSTFQAEVFDESEFK